MAVTTRDEIVIEEVSDFKSKPSNDSLGFGKIFTDRMLIRKWKDGKWEPARIIQHQDFSLSPSALVFHYGQAIFEGMKAFRQPDRSVKLFRPYENAKRMNKSAERMVMPTLDEDFFVGSIKKLVELESDWVPKKRGSSLYIRPTMIASEPVLGVKPSKEYLFFVILSPSGPYFSSGFNPTKIKVEDKYIRAAEGGTGFAKAAGNYAGSLLASSIAKEQGCDQVLWLDAKERRYVEEVGAMNIAFVINDEIHSPAPHGTILDGITRKSVKILAEDLGIPFIERKISIDEIITALENGSLTEIFGIGTAAVISPVGELKYKGTEYSINNNKTGPVAKQIFEKLTDIQYGFDEDIHNWML